MQDVLEGVGEYVGVGSTWERGWGVGEDGLVRKDTSTSQYIQECSVTGIKNSYE